MSKANILKMPELPEVPAPPDGLSPGAVAEWKRLAKRLTESGALTPETIGVFTCYCESFALWSESQRHPATQTVQSKNGGVWTSPSAWHVVGKGAFTQMARAAGMLGLSVAGVQKLKKPKSQKSVDKYSDILKPREAN